MATRTWRSGSETQALEVVVEEREHVGTPPRFECAPCSLLTLSDLAKLPTRLLELLRRRSVRIEIDTRRPSRSFRGR
jgi:hypothetical protein